MIGKLSFWPELASSFAWKIDAVYIFTLAICLFFGVGVFVAVVYFVVKYRRRSEEEIPEQIEGNMPLELFWSIVPLGICMVLFGWGTLLFFEVYTPPAEALNFYVVGKQWMWKIQHPSGKREINEMHVPIGQPVKLTITSEDVIHSFYIPAFRTKMDAVPGRYTTSWFEPIKTGEYHIFCAEYCGLNHSGMIGRIIVMEPTQYEQWLRTGNVTVAATNEAPEVAGARLFQEQRCVTCHQTNGLLGPKLDGVFGHEVKLQNGTTLIADETYVRESILNPQAKLVAGYPPVMPTFQGQLTEDALLQLIAYIKSLAKQEGGQPTGGQAAEAKPAEEKSGTEMKPPERQSEGQPDEGKPADAQPAEGQPAT